ncbi:MAG: hypothetical protein KC613_06615, partial [Myxococcales bacterium]|nr:hypothetical protein [Myxococcales bacterium]
KDHKGCRKLDELRAGPMFQWTLRPLTAAMSHPVTRREANRIVRQLVDSGFLEMSTADTLEYLGRHVVAGGAVYSRHKNHVETAEQIMKLTTAFEPQMWDDGTDSESAALRVPPQ